jgi:uncharacterized membrane protein YwaF
MNLKTNLAFTRGNKIIILIYFLLTVISAILLFDCREACLAGQIISFIAFFPIVLLGLIPNIQSFFPNLEIILFFLSPIQWYFMSVLIIFIFKKINLRRTIK